MLWVDKVNDMSCKLREKMHTALAMSDDDMSTLNKCTSSAMRPYLNDSVTIYQFGKRWSHVREWSVDAVLRITHNGSLIQKHGNVPE